MTNASKSNGLKDLIIVAFNRAAGQLALFLSTLYCSAFFDPASFGTLGLFTSLVALCVQFSSGRADAVALASKQTATAKRYVGMAYKLNGLFFIAAMVFCGFATANGAAPIWLAFPFAVLCTSLVQYVLPAQMTLLANAHKAARPVGFASFATAAAQIMAAFLWPTTIALILSRVLGGTIGLASVTVAIRNGLRSAFNCKITRHSIRPVQKEFLLGCPSAILTILGFQLPVYLLALWGKPDLVGYYWFGFNLLLTPYLVIAASFRPIFARRVVGIISNSCVSHFMLKATAIAIAAGIFFAVSITMIALCIVTFYLPEIWQPAGSFTRAIAIMLIGLVATTPLNAAATALRIQRQMLWFNATQLCLRTISLITIFWITNDAVLAIFAFATTSLVISLFYCGIMLRPSLKIQKQAFAT